MLERLRSLPVSKLERLENRWVHTYLPFPGLFARVVRRFLLYWRSIKIRSPLSLLRYFQYAWGGGRLLASRVWRFAICGAPWHTLENPIDG